MSDTEAAELETQKILDVEQRIAAAFAETMANDANITLQLVCEQVSEGPHDDQLEAFGGEDCQVLSSTISWQEETGQRFFIKASDLEAFMAAAKESNDALENFDSILQGWHQAAGNEFIGKLDPAPALSMPTAETRALSIEDLPENELFIKYTLSIGEQQFALGRCAPAAWEVIITASELEVTTVDAGETEPIAQDTGIEIENAEFGDLTQQPEPERNNSNLDMLSDLELDVIVELGRAQKPVQDILQLGRGSIIELEKLAGDPVEIYINNRKIAIGEVVVVDDHFGVRIIQLMERNPTSVP